MNIDKILGTMFSHIENSTVFCVCHVQLHRSFHLTIFDRTPIQLFNLTNCKWTRARPEWKSISIASSTCSFYACNMCEYESKTAIALATARNNIKKIACGPHSFIQRASRIPTICACDSGQWFPEREFPCKQIIKHLEPKGADRMKAPMPSNRWISFLASEFVEFRGHLSQNASQKDAVLGWFQTIFASSKGWDTWGEKNA